MPLDGGWRGHAERLVGVGRDAAKMLRSQGVVFLADELDRRCDAMEKSFG